MFTTVAFSESIDEAGVFANLNGVSDQHVKVVGDQITVPGLNQLIGAYACIGSTGLEARLVSPSLRRVNPLYIAPAEITLFPKTDPVMMYRGDSPVPLDVNESLEVEVEADPAAAEQHSVVVFLADGIQAPVTGPIHTVNCNLTVALVAGSWEFSELTFPDTLPVADYDIVGARAIIASAISFRFVPVGAINRPGGICSQAVASNDVWMQRYGRLGNWLSFNTVQPPGIEILSSAGVASATYEIYLDVIKH